MISEEEANNVLCNEDKNIDLKVPMFIDTDRQDQSSSLSLEKLNREPLLNINKKDMRLRKISDDSNMSNNFKNFQGSCSNSMQNPSYSSHNLVVRRNHKLCSNMSNIPPSITRLNFMGRKKLMANKKYEYKPQSYTSQKNVLTNI